MANDYPIRFTAQLRQHLRAIRKGRGLTQAQLAAMVGVSQARIAEIEANPGLVSFDQLMQLLSVLGVSLSLSDAQSTIAVEPTHTTIAAENSVQQVSATLEYIADSTTAGDLLTHPKKGTW